MAPPSILSGSLGCSWEVRDSSQMWFPEWSSAQWEQRKAKGSGAHLSVNNFNPPYSQGKDFEQTSSCASCFLCTAVLALVFAQNHLQGLPPNVVLNNDYYYYYNYNCGGRKMAANSRSARETGKDPGRDEGGKKKIKVKKQVCLCDQTWVYTPSQFCLTLFLADCKIWIFPSPFTPNPQFQNLLELQKIFPTLNCPKTRRGKKNQVKCRLSSKPKKNLLWCL